MADSVLFPDETFGTLAIRTWQWLGVAGIHGAPLRVAIIGTREQLIWLCGLTDSLTEPAPVIAALQVPEALSQPVTLWSNPVTPFDPAVLAAQQIDRIVLFCAGPTGDSLLALVLRANIATPRVMLYDPRACLAGVVDAPPSDYLAGHRVVLRLDELRRCYPAARVAIYGNGKHTDWLLAMIRRMREPITVVCIADDQVRGTTTHDTIPVIHPRELSGFQVDVIIPSSDTSEPLLLNRIHALPDPHPPAWPLYGNLIGPFSKPDPRLPRLSVCILDTGAHTPAELRGARESIRRQFYHDLEIIICRTQPDTDMSSSDGFEDVRVLPHHSGIPGALNALLNAASGDVITFLQPGHTYVGPVLREIASQFGARSDVTVASLRIEFRQPTGLPRIFSDHADTFETALEWWRTPPVASAHFFRRQTLLSLQPDWFESLDLLTHAALIECNKSGRHATLSSPVAVSAEMPSIPPDLADPSSLWQRRATCSSAFAGNDPVASHLATLTRYLRADITRDDIAAPVTRSAPRLSIITPVRNNRHLLPRAIHSVRAQGMASVEHVIMDGASTDGTIELLTGLEGLTWTSEPDAGPYYALNKGLARAGGEIIGVLNADDFYEPGVFRHVLDAFDRYPEALVVIGRLRIIAEDGLVHEQIPLAEDLASTLRWWDPTAYPHNPVCYFFRRRLLDDIGKLDPSFRVAADVDFVVRARKRTPFLRLPHVFGTWQIREQSLSVEQRACGRRELEAIVVRYAADLDAHEHDALLAEMTQHTGSHAN